ncbi:MAG: amino acid adenylation domain-containing protein, partial [Candidatus Omnitrophota bacterium]
MIIKRFEEFVERFPGKIAVNDGRVSLTYAELNRLSNAVANAVMAPDHPSDAPEVSNVSLLFGHNAEAIIGIIGTLKACKTYIPLDAGYPQKRLLYILDHSESHIILTNNANYSLAESLINQLNKNIRILNIDDIIHTIHRTDASLSGNRNNNIVNHFNRIERIADGKRIAYILYTSGSTGNPKGVVQNHENVLHFIDEWVRIFGITASHYLTLFSSLSHDAAIPDIFGTLLSGATLYPYDIKGRSNMEDLATWLQRERLNIWHSVPTFYRFFTRTLRDEQSFPDLELIVLGGEEVRSHDVLIARSNFSSSRFANIYGQTESTVNSIWLVSPEDPLSKVVIGEPIEGTEIFLVDESGCPVEGMGIGEIVVASNHVALGYWKDPENTENVFTHSELGRMYWTGDMGQLTLEGDIGIIGRKDFQLKIRGYRIEPGEIETVLLTHPRIQETVVVARSDKNGEGFLCAYLVSNEAISVETLREQVSASLPDYMIPRHFIRIEKMPLTPNGKIDRNALPEPREDDQNAEYEAPSNEIESQLLIIWKELMGKENIGVNSNFFELGGYSLLVITLIARIHQAFDVELQLKDVFDNQTIKKLSQKILEAKPMLFTPIGQAEAKEYYDVSPDQLRMFILSQLEGIGVTYNIYDVMRIEGKIDRGRFDNAYRGLIQRHESLRTSFEMKDSRLIQQIHEDLNYPTMSPLYRDAQRSEPNSKEIEVIIHDFIKPFDLNEVPLIRVGLIRLSEDTHLLVMDSHHIIMDGVSWGILVKEFIGLYNNEELPPLKLNYKDYTEWLNRMTGSPLLTQQEDYWMEQLKGEIPVLGLPTDYPRPAMQTFEGDIVTFTFDAEITARMKQLIQETGTTLYILLLTIYNIFLHKITGQEDMIVGSIHAGRTHADLEHMIGYFVKTLPLRSYPVSSKKILSFLEEVKEDTLNAFGNQLYAFHQLVQALNIRRDMSRNPLFDVLFIMQNTEIASSPDKLALGGLRVTPYHLEKNTAMADLNFEVFEKDNQVIACFQFCVNLFKRETIERFASYFMNIVHRIIENKDGRIADIEVMTEEERKQTLVDFNNTRVEYSKDKSIHELFEDQVRRTPDYLALVGKTSGRSIEESPLHLLNQFSHLTYRELNERADQLAGELIRRGIQPDTIVGLKVARSIDMIIGILGILKSGGAYLPLDPDYPQERVDDMLKDSGAKVVCLTEPTADTEKTAIKLIELPKPIDLPERPASSSSVVSVSSVRNHSNSTLAYVIYTSGSTGKPKGVMIDHSAIHNFMEGISRRIDFNVGKTILALTTITFDIFGLETLLPLCRGLRVILADEACQRNIRLLDQLIVKTHIDMLQVTPSRLQMFVASQGKDSCLRNLKEIMVGGEPLPVRLLAELKELTEARIYNMYGPTETTIWSTVKALTESSEITIGGPIANTQVYILNNDLRPQPVGVAGDLHIAGDGVARGYLNNPEMTAERFFPVPLMTKRIYKTGDICRWLKGGDIEFLGRIDTQVKIRGFRIELGEIENRLLNHGRIKDTVVTCRVDKTGDKSLCAYWVGDEDIPFSELKDYLLGYCPDYMIPSSFVKIDRIPLTPSGKVNRQALPEPELKAGQDYIAPHGAIEEKLAEIWSEILGIEKGLIGVHTNFFNLGGHSLKATFMVSRIHKALEVCIPLAEVFKRPTIHALSTYIQGMEIKRYESIQPAEEKEYYHSSSAQKRLFVLQEMERENTAYNIPAIIHLGEEVDIDRLQDAFKKLIARHESLRTSFHMVKGGLIQRVHEDVEFEIRESLTELTADTEGKLRGLEDFVTCFDLTRAPLMRAELFSLERHRMLVVDLHHIITDGTSQGVLTQDFMRLYKGETLEALRIQYKDFVEWQNKNKGNFEKQGIYWLNRFSDDVPVLNIPIDYSRPEVQRFEGNKIGYEVNPELFGFLTTFARSEAVTVYMVLLAILNVLLSKLSGQEDIVIGTPVTGRRHADLEKVIGMFVNTLALRNDPVGEKRFSEFLGELKERTLDAFENQEYPFEDLVETVVVNRDTSRNPLFDVMFTFQNMDLLEGDRFQKESADPSGGAFAESSINIHPVSKFDLEITAWEKGEGLNITFGYCTKIFKEETIRRFIRYFNHLMAETLSHPQLRIGEIDILLEDERNRILHTFNDSSAEYPKDKTIHELFEDQAIKVPDYIALIGPTSVGAFREAPLKITGAIFESPLQLSYRQLNEKADALAFELIQKGISSDNIVGLKIERSLEMIIGILGILRAGGAYLPIDPDYPQERIDYMVKDSEVKLVLATEVTEDTERGVVEVEKLRRWEVQKAFSLEYLTLLPSQPLNFLTSHPLNFSSSSVSPVSSVRNPSGLAYVIYTSGTTGKPKGTLIEHRHVVRLMVNDQFPFDFNERDVWTMFHSYCFDFSVWEMYGALLYGGKLAIIPLLMAKDPDEYLGLLKRENVTVLNQTPAYFYNLAGKELDNFGKELNIRYVIFGGEALNPVKLIGWKKKYPKTRLINMFGITETTVHVTFKELGEEELIRGLSNVGKPIPTLCVYIMDRWGKLFPIGVSGELVVGGEGVARGYLNRPELTSEKFKRNVMSHLSLVNDYFYKSGDLGRYLPDGDIEYLGRIDQQVKIRGFRIELGEVITRLLAHEKIKEAEVIVRENPQGEKYLCAYVVFADNVEAGELNEYLSQRLPGYMVPAHFIRLERMPLTPNGKLDRRALPEPGIAFGDHVIAPRNQTEKKLVGIWQEILGIENIGVSNSFFELGGNSLNVISLISFIHRDFQIKPTVAEIFRNETVEKQARLLKTLQPNPFASIEPALEKDAYAVSSVQRRLYFLQVVDPRNLSYNIPVVLRFEGEYELEKMETIFRELIARHESLRTSFRLNGDELTQKIHPPSDVEFRIEYSDLTAESDVERSRLPERIQAFIRPFALSHPPLFRVGILRLDSLQSIVMIDTHHIISDGISHAIFSREFMTLYNNEPLMPLRLQYKDFAEWLNTPEQVARIEKQEAYWVNRFQGELPLLQLPLDFNRPNTQFFAGDDFGFQLSPALTSSLNEYARKEGVTLFMVLLALFNLTLSRLSGQEDIIIGTSLAGRRHSDLENIIGMFINALALRNYPSAHKTFREFLQEVRENTLEDFENQDYPFESLVDHVLVERVPGRSPLFDVMMVLNNEEYPTFEIAGLKLSPYPFQRKAAQMDLKLRMVEVGEQLHCGLEYSTSLFKEESMRRLAGYFRTAAEAILENPNQTLSQIDLLPEDEKQRLLIDFNKTEQDYILDIPIHRLFEQQVEKNSDGIAAVALPFSISYKELNQRSNRLARLLIRKGVGRESVVGIMMEPGLDMIVGLLAILKAGAAYLPIDVDLPSSRALFILQDAGSNLLLSTGKALERASVSFTRLQNTESNDRVSIVKTPTRSPIREFDALPMPDRRLIDLSRYKDKIGMASVTRCMSLQATRGCPYECLFCHKVWSKKHAFRSAETIFNEVQFYYKQGVRNFAIIDDCFNLNRDNSSRFFRLVIRNRLHIQLFFPNGLRGDLLTPDYIDLMVEAGTRGINLSLETASPRLQKLIKKNLDIEKFKEVMDYIARKYPQVILEIATMHGFPTETEDEAMMTLDFIKSIHWLHFPYIHILKIYPNTEMEALALEHKISKEDILASKDLAFHELPETLPFPKRFTREYQSDFMNNYFLSPERLQQVLPVQLRVMGERATVAKYDTYLPASIKSVRDILDVAKLEGFTPEKELTVPESQRIDIFDRFDRQSPSLKTEPVSAKKILLLDLSQHFSSRNMLYNVVEQPLGLISLLTYLKQEFGDKISGKIAKSGIDFDSYAQLQSLVEAYQPDLVGIRTLTFYKEFFHETVSLLRQWGVTAPILAGGPYATSDYETILNDGNVDLVVFGEGEYTLNELIGVMLTNGFQLPCIDALEKIEGIAFVKPEVSLNSPSPISSRLILPVDALSSVLEQEESGNPETDVAGSNLAYVMYTSGSTGTPKGVMVEHRQANNCIAWMQETFGFHGADAIIQRTNLSFDPSVWEIFWPLSQGGKVKLLDAVQRKDAQYLIDLMTHPGDAVMMYCPATLVSALTYLLNSKTEKPVLTLPWLIIGAEPISVETVKMFYSYYQGKIVNTYGPTECAINNTYYFLERDDSRPIVPIGKPVANNQIYILSPHRHPMPLNAAGEIWIAGAGVARGYIRNEEKTRECFIDNPFGTGKLYKTGDIGRWLADGVIEIMGRADDQVKIRGHRIEPGEIEAALASHPSIAKCMVIARDHQNARQDIRYCKRCGIGSNYPTVRINEDQNCEICENINRYHRFFDLYFKSLDDLDQTIHALNTHAQGEEHSSYEKSAYDCLLLYSGGRGSAYALYQLVDRGFKVLAATYDNGYLSKKDLENIQCVTASLGVDHVTLTHPRSDLILKESMESAHTVCRGCYHTSSSLGVEYASRHHIPVVIGATLSRGQIIENKLFMFADQGITDGSQLEADVRQVQRSAPDIDRKIFDLIGIDIVSDRSVYERVTTLDFYRYCDISNEAMIRYLNNRDSYWKSRKEYAIYSTNCPIKQIGDFGHLKGTGFHYYGSATSWEKRLGHITMENLREDLQCHVTAKGYETFLERIGAEPQELARRDEKHLVAYYVSEKEVEASDIRTYLSGKVPPYMIPS